MGVTSVYKHFVIDLVGMGVHVGVSLWVERMVDSCNSDRGRAVSS